LKSEEIFRSPVVYKVWFAIEAVAAAIFIYHENICSSTGIRLRHEPSARAIRPDGIWNLIGSYLRATLLISFLLILFRLRIRFKEIAALRLAQTGSRRSSIESARQYA